MNEDKSTITGDGSRVFVRALYLVLVAGFASAIGIWVVTGVQGVIGNGQGIRVVPIVTLGMATLAAPGALAVFGMRALCRSRPMMRCVIQTAWIGLGGSIALFGLITAVPRAVAPTGVVWHVWIAGIVGIFAFGVLAGRERPSVPEGAAPPPSAYSVLPMEEKKAHLDAVASRQGRMVRWGILLVIPGWMALGIAVGYGHGGRGSRPKGYDLWDTQPTLALALFVGGAVLFAVGIAAISRESKARAHHVRLLEAHGVKLDKHGHEVEPAAGG